MNSAVDELFFARDNMTPEPIAGFCNVFDINAIRDCHR